MKELVLLLPEIFLALTVLGVLVSEIGYHGERTRVLPAIALIGFCGAFLQSILAYRSDAVLAFNRAFVIDGLALFFKLFFILLAGLTILACFHSREIGKKRRAECAALVGGATIAMCLAASAVDFLLIFLSLQLVNLLSYFLAALGRKTKSIESAIKAMIFSTVSGVLLLFGAAILFSHSGSLNIYEIHWHLSAHPLPREVGLVAFMLILLSLCFQIGAFPMYLSLPDVLEGAPTPVSGFLSVGTRAVGLVVSIRLLFVLFAQPALAPGQWQTLGNVDWPNILALLAGISMILGGLLAQRQTSAKRLVASLVIAETGFFLMGLLMLDELTLASLLYRFVVQLFAWMGTFYLLGFLYDQVQSDRLADFNGLLAKAVPECVALLLCLYCAIGLPPFPGFLAKFTLVGSALQHGWFFLAILAIASTALGAVAVTRLAFSLVGDYTAVDSKPSSPAIEASISRRIYLVSLLVPMVLISFFAEWILTWARNSLQLILW